MTQSHVLYLALSCCTVLLCAWTAVSALLRAEGVGVLHRTWTFVSALLLPAAAIAAALPPTEDTRWLIAAGTLLPLLAIAGTWCNVMTLQGQAFGLKALHLPVFLFNALLAGIYAVRVAQDLLGTDLGTWGAAVTCGHALLQTTVGRDDAIANPIWFHLPFVLPLCLSYRWPHVFALLFSSAAASALLALLITLMPFAFTRIESFRQLPAERLASLHGVAVGVAMPWSSAVHPQPALDAWHRHLVDLNPRSVSVDVRPEVFGQPDLLAQIRREMDRARALGMSVTAVACPSEHQLPGDMHALTTSMARVHWLTAEKLEPDLLVLYTDPFGRLAELTVKIGTIEEWMDAIRRGAAEVRQANPKVKVAVAIESRAPHAEELFRRLRADDSPIDAVGFAVSSGRGTMAEARVRLAAFARWCKQIPGSKPVQIFETGACPHTTGGELGQWTFLRAMLEFAAEQKLTAVTIDALADPGSEVGLIGRDGHRRRAFVELQHALGPETATPR